MPKVKRCEVCNEAKFILIEEINSGFNIFECENCGLLFRNPMPSVSQLKKLYEQIYSKKCNLPLAEDAFEKYSIDQEKGRIKDIGRFIKKGRILDIGASSGFFVATVNLESKFTATGVEYSLPAVKFASKNGIQLIRGDIFSNKIPRSMVDVITMHAVLDHIPNLKETVQMVNKRLRKGGLFVFSVANTKSFEFYLFKLLNKSFPGFIFEHLYYFNSTNIEKVLQDNGFIIKKITSRHHSKINFPPIRPLIGILTFLPKLFLEYTDVGGSIKFGNVLYVYAKKVKHL